MSEWRTIMDKKICDDLYYKFQEIYDSKMCDDSECRKANNEYDRIKKQIRESLPSNKQDLLEQLYEANSWQIAASKRILFYFMIKYLNTFLVEFNINKKANNR